ncbi:uncharacterized protein IL334_006165 [Kwoniella shivajii]|uniref:Phosphatidylglycerol/phosphatidylinositol transfer protein n=1 Tax=Kwoniella shivajii TaxID=564305 RepID=A0ABZ1D5R5_9TREE|nr:hypothetical protein IL334_006165 [Kwoniella shivajii]
MLFQVLLLLAGADAGVQALPTLGNLTSRQAGESHQVTMINKCGSGEAVFVYADHGEPQGSASISGPLNGGLAWMSGLDGVACEANGINCGIVEFTLINAQGGGQQNAGDYSILDGVDDEKGTSLGNHKFQYSMDFSFTGALLADNVGISITFCPTGPPTPNNAADPATAGGAAGTASSGSGAQGTSVAATTPLGGDSTSAVPSSTIATNPVSPNGAGSVAEGDPTPTADSNAASTPPATSAPAATSTSTQAGYGGGRGIWTKPAL